MTMLVGLSAGTANPLPYPRILPDGFFLPRRVTTTATYMQWYGIGNHRVGIHRSVELTAFAATVVLCSVRYVSIPPRIATLSLRGVMTIYLWRYLSWCIFAFSIASHIVDYLRAL